MEKLKKNVIKLVNVNSKIDNIQIEIKKLRKKLKPYETYKTKITNNLVIYLKNTNKNTNKNPSINYKDIKLSCIETKHTQSISKEYLLKSLTKYYNNKQEAEKVIKYIYDGRDVTIKHKIKKKKLKK